MKRLLLVVAFVAFCIPGFAWEECNKITYSTSFVAGDSSDEYVLVITITNSSDEVFPLYCGYSELVTTDGVTMEADDQCQLPLEPNESKSFEFIFSVTDPDIELVTMKLKLKNTLDETNIDYCISEFSFGVNDHLSIQEEVENLEYSAEFFDLLGRRLTKVPANTVYIEKRTYSNGKVVVEKNFTIDPSNLQ